MLNQKQTHKSIIITHSPCEPPPSEFKFPLTPSAGSGQALRPLPQGERVPYGNLDSPHPFDKPVPGVVCSLSMTPVFRRARTCMQRDRNKRPYNPSVMLRKRRCSMCSPLGPGLDILCNPALCCKSRLVPVRASFLRRRLFAPCLSSIRRHLSPA